MANRYKILAVLVLGVLGASGTALAASATSDSGRVGTWKVNVEKSIPPQGEVQHPYTVVTRRADTVLDFTFHTEKDGKPYQYSWNAQADGTVREIVPGIRGKVELLPGKSYKMTMWYDKTGMVEEQVCLLQIGGDRMECYATFTQAMGAVVFTKVVMDRVKTDS